MWKTERRSNIGHILSNDILRTGCLGVDTKSTLVVCYLYIECSQICQQRRPILPLFYLLIRHCSHPSTSMVNVHHLPLNA